MRKSRLIAVADQAYKNMMGLPALEGDRMALEQFGNPMGSVGPSGGVVPEFGAQIDINVRGHLLRGGALDLNVNKLPVPIFGYNDYKGNYAKNIGGVDLPANWEFKRVQVYPDTALGSIPNAITGDLIIEYFNTVEAHTLFIIINCANVAYASLLDATGSDRFKTNLLRYSLPSAVNTTQFRQPIIPRKQSLFGRTTDDSLNPISFKSKDQNQADIIDIPYTYDITKQTSLNTFVNWSSPNAEGDPVSIDFFSWSIFVTVAEQTISI